MREKKVLISAGGSGGHLFPAQMLAKSLLAKKRCHHLLFAAKGLKETDFFQKEEFSYVDITSASLSKHPWKLIKAFFCITKGLFQGIILLKEYRPDVVIGFGSYHTFPLLLAAFFMKKPIVLYESNASLGKVNRLFAKRAKKIVLQLPIKQEQWRNIHYAQFLPWGCKPQFVETFCAQKVLRLVTNRLTLLVMGGSQGACFINSTFLQTALELKKRGYLFQVIHIIGKKENQKQVEEFYQKNQISFYVKPYVKNIALFYCASDLVICRSGAGTIGDLVTYQIPAICIPYPYAKEGHQEKNATYFTEYIKGGITLLQKDISSETLRETIEMFLCDEKKMLFEKKKNILRFAISEKKRKRKNMEDIVMELERYDG